MPTFAIGDDDFRLDGEPFQVISGAMHYFRIHPDQWEDRIRKARQMGLNTIETYVPWNEHSPSRGAFRTDGGLDLGRYLDLIRDAGMLAIVRPGPYICAEWHDGGLPQWLLRAHEGALRSSDPGYLEAVREYLSQVHEIVRPRQIDAGGPVILMQIENEYGAYGSDAAYLRALVEHTVADGITVPLTTVDQPEPAMLERGGLDGVLRTGSFGTRAVERLATLREHQPRGPLMCSEFWCGWFDSWGEPHHTTAPEASAAELEALLSAGASVNIYMFHGGTNFGFTSGANDKGIYRPIVTSYDYDAPLAEDGTPTEKYWRFREVISRYAPVPDDAPAPRGPAPAFTVGLDTSADVLTAGLARLSDHHEVPDATAFGSPRGYARYQVEVPSGGVLTVGEVRDRAHVFVDHRPVGVIDRESGDRMIVLPDGDLLTLVVEVLGGVNYADRLGERKGLIGPVELDGVPLTGWRAGGLDLDPAALREALRTDGAAIDAGCPVGGPVLLGGRFDADASADLHLDTGGWGSGAVWVNGFALGRYSSRGPQRTLYVPAPVLRSEGNELLVLELRGMTSAQAEFVAGPDLGPTEF
ncbi:glycoside hydrolase family 35 protein [Microbacterium sp. NPDC057650]|uniref:glycoside hydrolase family 35 protein n=1 Tax=unclassified Microbacterium TaxID=2609290 RepID=UPI003671E796